MGKRALLVLLLMTFVSIARSEIGHGHSHDHGHGHSHDHGHGHSHGHEHSHGSHHHDDEVHHAGHGHHDDDEHINDYFHEQDNHFHEPAHFKYSREANQAAGAAGDAINKKASAQPPKKEPVPKNRQADLYDKDGLLSFMNNPSYRIWVYSIGSTLLISAAPFFILFFIPIDNNKSPESSPFLKILLSFASGGLLGDALLHLIPHSLYAKQADEADSCHDPGHSHGGQHGHSHAGHGHSHGPGHAHDMNVGLYVLMGITTFLIIEKVVRIVKGDGHGHGHSHGSTSPTKQSDSTKSGHHKLHDSDEDASADEGSDSGDKAGADASKGQAARSGGMELRQRKKPSDNKHTTSTSRSPKRERTDSSKSVDKAAKKQDQIEQTSEPQDIKVAGYLNLAADFAHNFTDGLAVGASYMAGTTVGLVTTLTVLVHEIPHEIGDFAILIQSGCSKRNAIYLQLVTAFGALLGCCISLSTSDPDGVSHAAESSWVLPFTAGGFIYVATVSVIPELLENSGLWQSIKEIAALFVGIGMMVLIAKFE